ncbi:hypothetical protein H113_02387, partial [Trichophyton rubrum MR1459]
MAWAIIDAPYACSTHERQINFPRPPYVALFPGLHCPPVHDEAWLLAFGSSYTPLHHTYVLSYTCLFPEAKGKKRIPHLSQPSPAQAIIHISFLSHPAKSEYQTYWSSPKRRTARKGRA